MLIAKLKLLKVETLPAKGDYPPSCLATLFDETTSDTLKLFVSDEATAAKLATVKQFSDVALELRWRGISLASLGGSGKGTGYRLSVVGLVGGGSDGGS
jgi:hypothetical protein